MAQQPSNTISDAPTESNEPVSSSTFTLHVVSPSVGVASPLTFANLPATTTIKELKAKVRDVLPSKPTDESQRLIHRGRMLGRDGDTMSDVFGQETLKTPESQTLHLVLRPTTSDGPSAVSSAVAPNIPPQSTIPFPEPPRLQSSLHPSPIPPASPAVLPQPLLDNLQQAQQVQYSYNVMRQRIQNLQREGNQLQRDMGAIERLYQATRVGQAASNSRTGLGQTSSASRTHNVFQQPGGNLPPTVPSYVQNAPDQQQQGLSGNRRYNNTVASTFGAPYLTQPPTSGEANPIASADHTSSHTREGVDANGHRWQVTVNESTTPISVHDLQQHVQQAHRQADQQAHWQVHQQAVQQAAQVHRQNQEWTRGLNEDSTHVVRDETTPLLPDFHEIFQGLERQNILLSRRQAQLAAQHNPARDGSEDSMHNIQNENQHTRTPIITYRSQIEAQRRAASAAQGLGNPGPFPFNHRTNDVNQNRPNSGSSSTTLANNLGLTLPIQPMSTLYNAQSNPSHATSPTNGSEEPTVYILSSPSGPQALLMTGSQMYFSPLQSRVHRTASPAQAQANGGGAFGLPEFRNRHAGRGARRNARQERENPLVPAAAPPANPEANALPAQAGPMLWLLVRLVGFVWFFTSGNTTWSRWLTVSAIAFGIFLFNTGIFNNVGNQIWAPIRRHLEALIPLAGPDAALVPAANAAAVPQAPTDLPQVRPGPRGELDPAQVAARLMEQQRRQQNVNGNWVRSQLRRVEHSLLLFLASLIPGVGERHIAAREAERLRQIDVANAAAAEAEAQAQASAANLNASGNDANGGGQEGREEPQQAAADGPPEQPQALPAQLIDI